MCFSPTASFLSGAVLSAAGGVTIKKTQKKSELPFAAIPLLFGIQQIIEGVIWISFDFPLLNLVMAYAYSIFSHVLWPIFVPWAVLLLENSAQRRKILYFFLFLGIGVGGILSYSLLQSFNAFVLHHSVAYSINYFQPELMMFLYLIATCGSCLFSSHRMVKIFGIVLFLSFVASLYFFFHTFISVWCFFAALLSTIVFLYFKHTKTSLSP